MQAKELYIQFCRKESHLPIFFEPWYLDAVTFGAWEAVVEEKGGQVVAIWPFYLKKKGPVKYVTMPPLTKFMGPYIKEGFRHPKQAYKILKNLIRKLPKTAIFRQNMHYSLQNWLPLYWEGFKQSTAYSYSISPLDDLEKVFSNICTDYRNNKIPKAQSHVEIKEGLPLEKFLELADASFRRQGMAFPVDFKLLERLDNALEYNQRRKVLYAVDEKNQIHSAIYLVWDQTAAYDLIAGDKPEFRKSGAGVFLHWEAIRYTAEVLKLNRFDFLGSMIAPIERVRRNFGAEISPYSKVERFGGRFWRVVYGLVK